MEQILTTRPKERSMEYHFKSDVNTSIFEPNDESTYTLIAYQVREALKELEDRIEVEDVIITGQDNFVFADIIFKVLVYGTSYETRIKVGEIT